MDFDRLINTTFEDVVLSDETTDRIRQRLDRDLQDAPSAAPEIMTLEETAEFLRVTPNLVYELMGDIPCFELGGRILFRREAVQNWIREQERRFKDELDGSDSKSGLELCM
jgi:excisionase family DNA binding protein